MKMENNQPVQPPVSPQVQTQASPVSQQPTAQAMTASPVQTSTSSSSKGGAGKKILLFAVVILLLLGILGGGYYLFLNSIKTKNAKVYVQPTTSITPTPQAYQSNPNDTSNKAITNDTSVANQSLGGIDASLNAVDQSLNDQPTNLQ